MRGVGEREWRVRNEKEREVELWISERDWSFWRNFSSQNPSGVSQVPSLILALAERDYGGERKREISLVFR